MHIIRIVVPTLVSAALFFGQEPATPRFEVASIRPTSGDSFEKVNVGVHIDGARVAINSFSLRDYVRVAYNVKDYQISGPEWMGTERFDVTGTLPEGSSQAQVRDMIKSLLADRFHIKLHHESKEFPVYALVIGKGPLKLVESALDPDTTDASKGAVNVAANGSRDGVTVNMGRGAYFAFANNKLEVKKLTTAYLAETLARFVDKPIVDMTGLTGTYDLTLNFTEEDYRAMLIRSAVNAGVVLPPQALHLMETASGDSLFSSIQEAGLKLDSRKAPLDVLVVDKIEKTPTEN